MSIFDKKNKKQLKSFEDFISHKFSIPKDNKFLPMNELLKDAEKYYNNGDKKISIDILNVLCEYIKAINIK
jgi:hypothetical protein